MCTLKPNIAPGFQKNEKGFQLGRFLWKARVKSRMSVKKTVYNDAGNILLLTTPLCAIKSCQ